MLRTAALVLLVANALLLAALAGVFDHLAGPGSAPPQREPERLQRQHQPELVRILDAPATRAALASAAASAAQAAAAASDAMALACLEAGPFALADAEAAERSLRDAGLPTTAWLALRSEDSGAFMIYMGRYADRETLQRKQEEVKRLKLEPDDLRGQPELQPGLGLGRFDSKAEADAALARMATRGLRTARVITLRQPQSQTLLRVPTADAALRARLAGLRLPSGPGFLPCAGNTAAAVAPAASQPPGVALATAAPPSAPVAATPASPAAARAPAQAASARANLPASAASAAASPAAGASR